MYHYTAVMQRLSWGVAQHTYVERVKYPAVWSTAPVSHMIGLA